MGVIRVMICDWSKQYVSDLSYLSDPSDVSDQSGLWMIQAIYEWYVLFEWSKWCVSDPNDMWVIGVM